LFETWCFVSSRNDSELRQLAELAYRFCESCCVVVVVTLFIIGAGVVVVVCSDVVVRL
jgi:hypothetical protein